MRNKYAETLNAAFPSIFLASKRKPKLVGTDAGKEFDFFKIETKDLDIRQCSLYTPRDAVVDQMFNTVIGNLLEKPVAQNCKANSIAELSFFIKKIKNTVGNSIWMVTFDEP